VCGARHVKADTDLQNLASQNVLAEAGFREISRSDKLIYFMFPYAVESGVPLAGRGAKVVTLSFGHEPGDNAPARPLAFKLVCSE